LKNIAGLIKSEGALSLLKVLKETPQTDPDGFLLFSARLQGDTAAFLAECMSRPPSEDAEACFNDCVAELRRMEREDEVARLGSFSRTRRRRKNKKQSCLNA
jgi:hypothetical protein